MPPLQVKFMEDRDHFISPACQYKGAEKIKPPLAF